ncbi:MAG: dTDP-4-dehydrorhamnose 3,5-epimerase [Thermodesulfobacteriota bacterium]
MNVIRTELSGVLVVEPKVHRDARGFFVETFQAQRYADAGIRATFVQDNHSCSVRGTLRGLHAQLERPQAKLVRVLRGAIWDVVVDVRRGSPTFKRWIGVELTEDNFRQIYVPIGFAHGFCVTSDVAEVEYKCSDYYQAGDELGLAWDDPEIGVRWPVEEPLLSDKDRAGRRLAELLDRLPRYEGT